MHCESRTALRDLSLRTTAELCTAFETDINVSCAFESLGKSGVTAATPAATTNTESGPDSVRILLEAEQVAAARVLEEAAREQHKLLSGTLDDEEAAVLRMLPRATIELLLLTLLDGSKSMSAELLGPTLGPAFRSLVACHTARRSAQPTAAELLPASAVVRRGGTDVTIRASEIVAGDVLLLADGDHVPVDAMLLDIAPKGHTCAITAQRINGSRVPVPRRAGSHVACAAFGAESVLPQQTVVHVPSSGLKGKGRVAAIALNTSAGSSWTTALRNAAHATRAVAEPPSFAVCRSQPIFLAPQPAVVQLSRHALQCFAQCDVVLVDCEKALLDDAVFEVRACQWDGAAYRMRTSHSAWNFSDVLHKQNSASSAQMSLNQSSVVSVSSYGFEGDSASRISVVSAATGLRSLAVAGMLATCYDSATPLSLQQDAVRRFLLQSDDGGSNGVPAESLTKFRPVCDAACVVVRGKRVFARLFRYTGGSDSATHSRHGVLVAWGSAETIAEMTTFAMTTRGQWRIDRSGLAAIGACARSDVCDPSFLLGVATADIALDLVGAELAPPPTDVATLLAQTTSLCYQGAFACAARVRQTVAAGLAKLAALPATVLVMSATLGEAPLRRTLECAAASASFAYGGEVVVPDVLERWKTQPPPKLGAVVGVSAVGVAIEAFHRDLVQWLQPRIVGYCAATCLSASGMRACHAAAMVDDEGDDVTRCVLRNFSSVSVRQFALDDFADAIAAARRHTSACQQLL